jgi:putative ABC transport system permease protein
MPLNEKIIPQLFCHFENKYYRAFFVRIPPGNPSASLATIEKTWNKLVSDVPFKYSFLDDKIDAYYKAEHRWGSIIGWAGGISIFLACLGLFGLASLTAVNRTKEIGIRKVMGAGMQDIVLVLSKNYLLMVSVSILMAAPISWWLMNKWLDKFAYRIQISGWIFLIVGMVSVLLAFATVAYQSVKAAIANPIESLRSE